MPSSAWTRPATHSSRRPAPRPEDALSELSASKTKGDTAYDALEVLTKARAQQLEAKRCYDQKCNEFAEAETNLERATGNVLEKAAGLEKHVKTTTTRAESLGMTEVVVSLADDRDLDSFGGGV